jgi:hypothetical protein
MTRSDTGHGRPNNSPCTRATPAARKTPNCCSRQLSTEAFGMRKGHIYATLFRIGEVGLGVSLAIATQWYSAPGGVPLRAQIIAKRDAEWAPCWEHRCRCADLGRMCGQAECRCRRMLSVWRVFVGARTAKLPADMMRTKSEYGVRSVSTESEATLAGTASNNSAISDRWRRRRDSNPRYALRAYNGLANRRLQPLGHISAGGNSL